MIDPASHTLSEAKKTWNDWMRQKYRHYTTSKYYKPIHKFLLGLYSLSLVLFYPLFAASIVFYTWWLALSVLGLRLLIQAIILHKTMKKLNEKDLWPFFILFDIWMFFYFLITLPALWKKPKQNWN
jgi:hypothetical protein